MKKLIRKYALRVRAKIYNGAEVVLSVWTALSLNAVRFIYNFINMKGDILWILI